MIGPSPKPGIGRIDPYVAGKAAGVRPGPVVKLSSNENALGAGPRAIEAFEAARRALHRYPDPQASELRDALEIALANALEMTG